MSRLKAVTVPKKAHTRKDGTRVKAHVATVRRNVTPTAASLNGPTPRPTSPTPSIKNTLGASSGPTSDEAEAKPFVVNEYEIEHSKLARLRERASRTYEKSMRTAHVARSQEKRIAAKIKADVAVAKLRLLREAMAAIAHLAPKSHVSSSATEYCELYRHERSGGSYAYGGDHIASRLRELEAIAPKAAEYMRSEQARFMALPVLTEDELAVIRAAETERFRSTSQALAGAFMRAVPDSSGIRTFTL